MTMHTPGPWTAGNDGYIYSAGDIVADSTFGCLPQIEGDHNARLIAAAPDLLEALEQCLTGDGANCLAYGTDTPSMRRRFAEINRIATEAIRKAKGE